MAAKDSEDRTGFERVIVPRDLDYRIHEVMSLLFRKILEAAARRTVARDNTSRYASISAEDVLLAVGAILPDASADFELALKEFKKKNVRRAS